MANSRPVYLDYQATTPVDPRVLELMLPYFCETFGNAASVDHEAGATAQRAVEAARAEVATALNASPAEIIFTSGATEANNLAILGVAQSLAERGRHIVTSVTEHPAVLDPCRHLGKLGWEVTYLPVDSFGLIDPQSVAAAIRPDTVLVSIMTANNEIGTIASIRDIGHITSERGVYLHTDATQAIGKLPIDVERDRIDLLSLSAHKIYGPKGVGALYVRRRSPRVRVKSQIHGGSHERGLRSGTLNVPGIVGLGAAIRLVVEEMPYETERLRSLRDLLWQLIKEQIADVELNGHPTERLPNNLSVAIAGVEAKALLVELKHDLYISAGSACSTTKVEPSHVIRALGFPVERAYHTVRIGLGQRTTERDIKFASTRLLEATTRIRRLCV